MKLDDAFGREILTDYACRSGALRATLRQLIDALEIAQVRPRASGFTRQSFERALDDARQLLAHLSAHDEQFLAQIESDRLKAGLQVR
jgi:hypothetical protein